MISSLPESMQTGSKQADGRLYEIDKQIDAVGMADEVRTEINCANNLVKNGVTMRRKRELEEKLETLEKQKNTIRSQIRLNLVK